MSEQTQLREPWTGRADNETSRSDAIPLPRYSTSLDAQLIIVPDLLFAPTASSMLWTQDTLTVSCIADPRCLADHPQAHLVDNPLMRGTIPLHKLFTLTYVSRARLVLDIFQSPEFSDDIAGFCPTAVGR